MTSTSVDIQAVKSRSLSGIVTLISRSFIIRIIGTIGLIVLSGFIGPVEFGLYVAVNDLVSILGYFSDIGLSASLIQKKETVSLSDLRTSFTIQQGIVSLLIVLSLAVSPWIFDYYKIDTGGIWLFWSLLAGFFLASLKTIPSVILEREVKFEVLALVEVVESLVFYLTAIFMAMRGYGVYSYAWAVFLRGVVGTLLLYKLSPWNLGIEISRASVRSLLRFGIPYQVNSLLAVIKDRVVNIALWRIVGAGGVGIVGWAQNLSQLPLRFIMDNVTKVTFPSFSRLQNHPEELKKAIEKTLLFISFLSFPLIVGFAAIAPLMIRIFPQYSRWEPALLPLALYSLNSLFASVSTPLTNTLNAMGQVKTNSYLMVMWTVLTWTLTPILAIKYGYMGVAMSAAIISFSSLVPILIVQGLTNFSLRASLLPPILAALGMLAITLLLGRLLPVNLYYLGLNILISAVVYLLISLALIGQSLLSDSKKILYAFKTKK